MDAWMRGNFCPFIEKKDSGYDPGIGVKGEIKGDMLVCSLGKGIGKNLIIN